jgi:hypothetical protein
MLAGRPLRFAFHALVGGACVAASSACSPGRVPPPRPDDAGNTAVAGPVSQGKGRQVVPARAPDTVPAWIYDDSSIVRVPDRRPDPFVKDLIAVLFAPSASQAQRQAAIDAVDGTVVGGARLNGVDGLYLVSLPRDTTHSRLFQAMVTLKAMPGVVSAQPDYIYADPTRQRPPQ